MPWQSAPLQRPFVRRRENPLPSLSLYRRNRAERGYFFFAWQEDGLLHRYTLLRARVSVYTYYTSTLGSPSPSVFLQDAHQASPNTIIRCDCRGILYDALLLLWQCIDCQIFEL